MTWTSIKQEAEIKLPHLTLTGKVEYDSGQQALTIADPATGEEEVLSVNPTDYGYIAFPGEVFAKDRSEHRVLPVALEQRPASVQFPPPSLWDRSSPLPTGCGSQGRRQPDGPLRGDRAPVHCWPAIQYPNESAAEHALEKSFFIHGLCREDCLDAYDTQEPMDGYEVVIPPDDDTDV